MGTPNAPLFRLPSVIVRNAQANTFRQYGSVVYRCLQERLCAETLRNLVIATFHDPVIAQMYMKQIQDRVEKSLPVFCESEEEEVCILPPLFIRAEEDVFAELTPTLYLLAFESGPVFPLMRIPLGLTVAGDQALEENLYEIYEAVSEQKIGPKLSFDDLFESLRTPSKRTLSSITTTPTTTSTTTPTTTL